MAVRLSAGPFWADGFTPATWPASAALAVALLALASLRDVRPAPPAGGGGTALAVLGVLVAGVGMMPWLGFPASMAAVLAVLSRLFGARAAWRTAALAPAGSVAVWLFFERVMRFPLPDGRLWSGAWIW